MPDDEPWKDHPVVAPGPGEGESVLASRDEGGDPLILPPGHGAAKELARSSAAGMLAAANTGTAGMFNRLNAGALTAAQAITGKPADYWANVDRIAKQAEKIREDNPISSAAGDVAGGVALGGGLPRVGLTTVPYLASRLGRTGTVLGNVGEAAALNAAQGAGQTYTGNPTDYVQNAIESGAWGAPFGILAPAAGAAGASYSRNIAPVRMGAPPGMPDWMGTAPPRLRNATAFNPDAVERVATGAYGPRGMLADAFPVEAQGAVLPAGALPLTPGQLDLRRNLATRDATSGETIDRGVDALFGRAPPSLTHIQENFIDPQIQALSPLYTDAYRNARRVDTTPIAHWLEGEMTNATGDTYAALARIRGELDLRDSPGTLDPYAGKLGNLRSDIRGILRKDEATPGGTLQNDTRRMLEQAERRMTTELQANVPGIRDLDSRERELYSRRRALDPTSPASRVFDPGRTSPVVRPADLRQALDEAARPKGTAGPSQEADYMRIANRAELDRVLGTSRVRPATVGAEPDIGHNELKALRDLLTPYNLEKTAMLQGQRPTEELARMVGNENLFRAHNAFIQGGTQTANRLGVNAGIASVAGEVPTKLSQIPGKVVDWASKRLFAEEIARTRDALARYMASNDPAVAQAAARQLQRSVPVGRARDELTRTLLQGGFRGAGAGVTPKQYQPRLED